MNAFDKYLAAKEKLNKLVKIGEGENPFIVTTKQKGGIGNPSVIFYVYFERKDKKIATVEDIETFKFFFEAGSITDALQVAREDLRLAAIELKDLANEVADAAKE